MLALINKSRKKFFKQQFQQLNNRVYQGFNNNQISHNQIKQEVIVQTEIVTAHTKEITRYLQQKNIANTLRQISKHAIQYCGNRELGKILDTFTQQFIIFVQDITDIGFQNTTKQQILIKLSVARQNTNKFSSTILGQQKTLEWHNMVQGPVQKYVKQVFQIYSDEINNKNIRFLTKSQDLAQTIVRDFILFCANLNYIDLQQMNHTI